MDPVQAFQERLLPHLDRQPRPVLPPRTELAAVLIPVLAADPELRVVFTRRTDTLSRHAGEISFPGGMADPGEDPAETALRETQEELGLAPDEVELLGALPPVHTVVTGVLIVPFVGFLWKDPAFTPNADEIAEVLEYPLADLDAMGTEREIEREGMRFLTYVFDMEGNVIWGATARILWSFLETIRSSEASIHRAQRER